MSKGSIAYKEKKNRKERNGIWNKLRGEAYRLDLRRRLFAFYASEAGSIAFAQESEG